MIFSFSIKLLMLPSYLPTFTGIDQMAHNSAVLWKRQKWRPQKIDRGELHFSQNNKLSKWKTLILDSLIILFFWKVIFKKRNPAFHFFDYLADVATAGIDNTGLFKRYSKCFVHLWRCEVHHDGIKMGLEGLISSGEQPYQFSAVQTSKCV